MTTLGRIVLAIGAVCINTALHAAPTLSARIEARSSAGDGWGTYTNGPQILRGLADVAATNAYSQIVYPVEQTAATWPVSGESLATFARVAATAGVGHLHAFADAVGHSDGIHTNYYGSASGDARTSYTDTIWIEPSAGHAAGSWVTVYAKLELERTMFVGPGAELEMLAKFEVHARNSYDTRDGSGNPFGVNNYAFPYVLRSKPGDHEQPGLQREGGRVQSGRAVRHKRRPECEGRDPSGGRNELRISARCQRRH